MRDVSIGFILFDCCFVVSHDEIDHSAVLEWGFGCVTFG
jgi:hypothetical protein